MLESAAQPRLQLVPDRPRVHLTLQGKGGVGKSLISSFVAQYLLQSGVPLKCVDTDPVNDTLSQVRALHAKHLNLMHDGRVDERVFDDLIEGILDEPISFVVDTGATSFVALTRYLEENDALQMLREQGRDVLVHTVIAGGQACRDTLYGFRMIAQRAAPQSLLVWLNEYFGPVELEGTTASGAVRRAFQEMKLFEENKEAVLGIVNLPRRNPDTFGRDIRDMLTQKLTFEEVIASDRWSIMAKSRIAAVQRELYEQLEAVLG